MAYQVLARKYRPLSFSDVVGQDHVTRTLLNALAQNRIAHGYIFSGHRGIGKTTIARILASALNCRRTVGSPERPTPEPCNSCESCLEIRQGSSVDVIEIDAATNRGIDEVRELRDAARYQPARDKFKIIILDEAHQITDAAFNALLKTLEEPPDHIVFMFATTEPENIPQTIRSRCQHFSFHAVKLDDIVGQLRKISDDEQLDVDNATLSLLAEAGDGSMRDALSIMDQAIASAPLVDGKPHLALEQVRELMGSVSNVIYEQVLGAVDANNSADVLSIIARLLDAGNGPTQIARQFVRFLRNCVVAKITALQPDSEATGIAADLLQISPEERSRAARAASRFTEEDLSRFLAIMLRTFDELGYRQEQRFHLELGLLKLVHVQRLLPVEELLSQLGVPAGGGNTAKPVTTPSAPRAAATPSAAARPATTPARPSAATPTTADAAPKSPAPAKPSTSITDAFGSAPGTPKASLSAAPAPTPAVSFERESSRKAPQPSATSTETTSGSSPLTNGSLAIAPEPAPAAKPAPQLVTAEEPPATPFAVSAPEPITVTPPEPIAVTPLPEPVPPAAPIQEAPAEAPEEDASVDPAENDLLTKLQAEMTQQLAEAKGQETASHQIEDATFTLKGTLLEIQTTVSKAMLPVILNAEANRILTATLRELAPELKLTLLPGTPANAASAKKPKAARAGSVQELAEKHPLVQEARRLFSAEISNVIDLRK
ncbi:MAG: DNA polymerase III subunit gamma/tau [Acidobacteriaceae bacterium]|nr:DNA polymerase III subunit gamma/tau [Acidobacteriaceae bacterium]